VDNTPEDKLGVWRDMHLADALVLKISSVLGELVIKIFWLCLVVYTKLMYAYSIDLHESVHV